MKQKWIVGELLLVCMLLTMVSCTDRTVTQNDSKQDITNQGSVSIQTEDQETIKKPAIKEEIQDKEEGSDASQNEDQDSVEDDTTILQNSNSDLLINNVDDATSDDHTTQSSEGENDISAENQQQGISKPTDEENKDQNESNSTKADVTDKGITLPEDTWE